MRFTTTALFALILSIVGSLVPAHAQVRGISYTLSPTGAYIFASETAGLEDHYLYGGELGFGFGRLVELNAVYLFNNDLSSDFGELDVLRDDVRDAITNLDTDGLQFQRYGGKLKLNLATGAIVPFVKAGGGILRYSPDEGPEEERDATRTIYGAGGVGLQFSLADRYTLTVEGETFGYQYDPATTFFTQDQLDEIGLDFTDFGDERVVSYAVRASLLFYLGGRDPDDYTELDYALQDQFSGGLSGLSLQVEPFGGAIRFDESLGFRETQRMAGAFAGINLGPYVGLRGFYWRGIEEGAVTEFDDLQAYGGEMKLNLDYRSGLRPYLTFGGGYLEALDGYEGDDPGIAPEDGYFAMGGVGAVLPFGQSVQLHADARYLLMSESDLEDVTQPDDVVGNLMYSAGISFNIGREPASAGSVIEERLAREREEDRLYREQDRLRATALEEELEMTQARLDSLERRLARGDLVEPDSLTLVTEEGAARVSVLGGDQPRGRTGVVSRRVEVDTTMTAGMVSDRLVTIPLPEQGELYIRFGEPGGVEIGPGYVDSGAYTYGPQTRADTLGYGGYGGLTAQQVEQIVRTTVRDELAQTDMAALSGDELIRIEERINDRLAEIEQELSRELNRELTRIDDDVRSLTAEPNTVVIDRTGNETTVVTGDEDADALVADTDPFSGGWSFVGGSGLGTVLLGDAYQVGVGVRGRLEQAGGTYRILPEFGIGVGEGNYSYHLNLNVAASVAEQFSAFNLRGLQPYAGVGVGLLGFDDAPSADGVELTFNLLLGTDFYVGGYNLFAEYATYDLFDYNRFALGYRVTF